MSPSTGIGRAVETAGRQANVYNQLIEVLEQLREVVTIERGIQRQLGILEPESGAEGKEPEPTIEPTIDLYIRMILSLSSEARKRLTDISNQLGG